MPGWTSAAEGLDEGPNKTPVNLNWMQTYRCAWNSFSETHRDHSNEDDDWSLSLIGQSIFGTSKKTSSYQIRSGITGALHLDQVQRPPAGSERALQICTVSASMKPGRAKDRRPSLGRRGGRLQYVTAWCGRSRTPCCQQSTGGQVIPESPQPDWPPCARGRAEKICCGSELGDAAAHCGAPLLRDERH